MIQLAGANAAIGTLWNLWDTAGSEFVETFYEILRDQAAAESDSAHASVNVAEALRRAALDIRKRRPEPYFWALFVLYGNWTIPLIKGLGGATES
ncbi:hypothetical protein BDY21DRAFT_350377 [Lineolata rhizophorae]|uniref:CHAT domain-containing protein n=1 Tax=Lineolata rhizophorae TaxID=578093 RepID=A0A6A6NU52_9PEZI|nr:hypothetical protein BDY21DRAFT_350377 [Lineolata rhizophorae]